MLPSPKTGVDVSGRDELISPYKIVTDKCEPLVYATSEAREIPQWPRVIPLVNAGQSTLKSVGATQLVPVPEEHHYEFSEEFIRQRQGEGDRKDGATIVVSDETLKNDHIHDLQGNGVAKNSMPSRFHSSKPSSAHSRPHPYESSEKFISQSTSSKLSKTPSQRDWSTLPINHYEFASNQTVKPLAKLKPWKARKRPQDDVDIDPMYATPHTRRQSEVCMHSTL